MVIHDFNNSLEIGKEGESKIIEMILTDSGVESIEDLSEIREYQEKDIDLRVLLRSGKSYTLEIKTDNTIYPNLFYETMSAVETGSIGAFDKTEADMLAYYYIKLNLLYLFKMKDFQKWVKENKELFDKKYLKNLKNYRYNGINTYTTKGYAIPRVEIEKQDFVKKKKLN